MKESSQAHIRTFTAAEWPIYKAIRLRALADSPDSFGSTLAAEEDWPDAVWSERLAHAMNMQWNLPLIAELDGEPIGLAWGRIEEITPDIATLYQMWVSPNHRGMKVGKMLLDAVITWATARNASWLHLDVRSGNQSCGATLPTRAGFEPFGELEPVRPGSPLFAQPMRRAL